MPPERRVLLLVLAAFAVVGAAVQDAFGWRNFGVFLILTITLAAVLDSKTGQ